MSEWKECKLGDIVTFQRGFDITKKEQIPGIYPVVSSSGVKSYHKSAKVKGPGITIGRKGTLGTVFYLKTDFWPHDTTLWVKDFHGNIPSFIYYFLKEFHFELFDVGSSNPTLNRNHIHLLATSLPPLPEQRAIASVLSSLDDKIDLLHRQNKTLEAMAETLFRQWFVEGAEEGWAEYKIGEKLKVLLGGTPSTKKLEYWNGNIPWINSGEINKFRILEPTKYITQLGLDNSSTKLLPKGTTVLAITGATLGQVSILEIDACANQSVIGILGNKEFSNEYIYLWIKHYIKYIILNQTGGAQQHININDVKNTTIIKHGKVTYEDFMKIIKPIFDKISKNSFQIRTLEKLRDTLLPKLMSGEVRVKLEQQEADI